MRLGRLQPAGSHLQDLQGATDGRPAAVLFDRLRHARWQPAQGPGRSHSSRPPPLRPVRHPRRRHLLPAPSIRRAVPAARLAGPAARGWRLPQVRRALGHENVLRGPPSAAQFAGQGSPPGAACGWPLPTVRRARREGYFLRAPSPAAQRASQLKRFRRWARWPRAATKRPSSGVLGRNVNLSTMPLGRSPRGAFTHPLQLGARSRPMKDLQNNAPNGLRPAGERHGPAPTCISPPP